MGERGEAVGEEKPPNFANGVKNDAVCHALVLLVHSLPLLLQVVQELQTEKKIVCSGLQLSAEFKT